MHEVRLGDCIEGMRTLADKSVDHVICDPPYEAEAHTLQRRVKRGATGIENEPLDFGSISEETRTEAARQIVRICRGWVVVFCQAEAVASWRRELEAAGAKWRRPMVWVKPDGQPCLIGDRPGMGYESMAAAWAGEGRSSWNGGGKVGVYSFNKSNSAGNDHPTQKPEALMEALVRDFTSPDELICDPFSGLGTTGVACKRLGRRFIGWELQEKYQRAAQARIDATREQLELVRVKAPKAKQGALALGGG